MQVLVLYETLVELVDARLLIEMAENVHIVNKIRPNWQVDALLGGLTQPHQKVHNIIVDPLVRTVQQVLLFQLAEYLSLLIDLLGQLDAILVVVYAQTQEELHNIVAVLKVTFHDF